MSDAGEIVVISAKKPRKARRLTLGRYTNAQVAGVISQGETPRDQWEMLCILERLHRKGNKARRLPPELVRPLVDFFRPEAPARCRRPRAGRHTAAIAGPRPVAANNCTRPAGRR